MGIPNRVSEETPVTIRLIDRRIKAANRNTVDWAVARGRFEAHEAALAFYDRYRAALDTKQFVMIISVDGGHWKKI